MADFVLGNVNSLSKSLQGATTDYSTAMQMVDSVIALFHSARNSLNDADGTYAVWWGKTEIILKDYKVIPNMPRRTLRTNAVNPDAETPFEYFKCLIARPFLDNIIEYMELRFNHRSKALAAITLLIPRKLLQVNPAVEAFKDVLELHAQDLTGPVDFEVELKQWKAFWSLHASPSSSVEESIAHTTDLYLRNIGKLLRIFAVTPGIKIPVEF